MKKEDYLLAIDQMHLYGVDRQQMRQSLRLLYKLPRGVMQFLVILQNCSTLAKRSPNVENCGKILVQFLQRYGHVVDLKPEKFATFNPKKFDDTVENFPGLSDDMNLKEKSQPLLEEDFADFREKKVEINNINFPGLT